MKLVTPEVMTLQYKKRKDKAHKNGKAENYYSYANSIVKNMAFIPFTEVFYNMEKPEKFKSFIFSQKNGSVQFNYKVFPKNELAKNLNNVFIEHECEVSIFYDKNISFGEYIQDKIFFSEFS
ncbi:hypothetical protein [Flavobacterium sp. ACAM 123]|uniref:hypothetical protein n=1 Tax=Flavobacterium sp. ACAM 123 TaxID=1189620 RepID=UPI0002F6F4F8|nr:hypothetical protein [Flavobacterium sp. ACAM 123]